MNINQIGPKLESSDHQVEENKFLEAKKAIDSIVLDDSENTPQNLNFYRQPPFSDRIKILKEDEDGFRVHSEKKTIHKKNMNVKFSEKSECPSLFPEKKKSKKLMMLNVVNKSKSLALQIKKIFFYKNFKNMNNFQKSLLNDATDFSKANRKKMFIQVIFYNII